MQSLLVLGIRFQLLIHVAFLLPIQRNINYNQSCSLGAINYCNQENIFFTRRMKHLFSRTLENFKQEQLSKILNKLQQCHLCVFFSQFLYFTKSIGVPYVVVKVRRYKVATKYLKSSLDCNETFAFKEEQINSDEEVEILPNDGAAITIGKVSLLISDTLRHDSFGTSYAPYWYALKDRNNRNINMEVNLTY